MTNILFVTSSALGEASVTGRLVDALEKRLRIAHPGAKIVRRDIGANPVPHLTPETISIARSIGETPAAREALALSDALIAEIKEADLIVIGAPMYNFGMSSTLKAWFDYVLRAGITFRYTEAGSEGLVTGKKAIVLAASAGVYEGATLARDSQEPHIRTLLAFMGITDITFIRADGLAFGEEAAATSIERALVRIDDLTLSDLPLAA